MSLKIAVIGEGVIDRFIEDDGINDVIGGSSLNTAVALSRSGVQTLWWGRMSSGAEGSALVTYAKDNQVSGEGVLVVDAPASIVTISLDAHGVPTYGFALEGASDWGWTEDELKPLSSYDVIHCGSLTSVLEPGSSALLKIVRERNPETTLVTYDPNARPLAAATQEQADFMRQRAIEFVTASNFVKVSDEDLEWLSPDAAPASTAALWSTQGPTAVVMTRGAHGAAAFVNGEMVTEVPGVKVDVVDTVGAGDTFMAWLISGLITDHNRVVPTDAQALHLLMDRAAVAAAINCSRKGCVPPFAAEVNL